MAIATPVIHFIETELASIPVYQYAFFKPQDIVFRDVLRMYCKRSCRHYKSSWSCPPAIESVEKCIARCLASEDGMLFSTIQTDLPRNLSGTMGGEQQPVSTAHEQVTGRIEAIMKRAGKSCYTLTGNVCTVCRSCSYPKESCRYPDLMHPCIESHGISIAQLADQCGMDYYLDDDAKLQFSIIFLSDPA
ncbi:MAG: DUF2284 domain-containing protein [Eubacterium sp.]|nr:DUF2284 domain-containing protein [Eubacterium sp.]